MSAEVLGWMLIALASFWLVVWLIAYVIRQRAEAIRQRMIMRKLRRSNYHDR
jgi:hypothetical protein